MHKVWICTTALLTASMTIAATHHKPIKKQPAAAETVPAAPATPSQLSLTVYNNDLVMVQDIRTLDIQAGRSRIEFPDVSAAIRPETVSLTAKGVGVVEQNFDYDLLTPAKMMEKQVGHEIGIVRTNPATGAETAETATVLSTNEGVVLRIGKRIEALRDDGLPTRVVFGAIPENLRASPTLSVTVEAEQGGPHQVNLSYLARGLSWGAAYVGMYDEKRDLMSLQGWITITNSSGTGFKNADTELIAGSINATSGNGAQSYTRNGARVQAGTAAQQGAEEIADFYAYRLPERVTVANQQTKQIAFLDLQGAQAKKTYVYYANWFSSSEEPQHADTVIDFLNGDKALPQGTVRIYMRDARGEPKFVGENALTHTPAGSNIGIDLGQAFDVTVQPTVVSTEKLTHGARYSMSYLVRNARAQPVTVELHQGGLYTDGEVEDENFKSRRVDASNLVWHVPVPAHGETRLTAVIKTGA